MYFSDATNRELSVGRLLCFALPHKMCWDWLAGILSHRLERQATHAALSLIFFRKVWPPHVRGPFPFALAAHSFHFLPATTIHHGDDEHAYCICRCCAVRSVPPAPTTAVVVIDAKDKRQHVTWQHRQQSQAIAAGPAPAHGRPDHPPHGLESGRCQRFRQRRWRYKGGQEGRHR